MADLFPELMPLLPDPSLVGTAADLPAMLAQAAREAYPAPAHPARLGRSPLPPLAAELLSAGDTKDQEQPEEKCRKRSAMSGAAAPVSSLSTIRRSTPCRRRGARARWPRGPKAGATARRRRPRSPAPSRP